MLYRLVGCYLHLICDMLFFQVITPPLSTIHCIVKIHFGLSLTVQVLLSFAIISECWILYFFGLPP